MKFYSTVTFLLFAFTISGQVKTWTGIAGDKMWDGALNWNPIGVPNSLSSVKILSDLDTIIIPSGYSAEIKDLVNQGSLKVKINANLTISNSDSIGLKSTNLFVNKGTVTIKDIANRGATLNGKFNNFGDFILESNITGTGIFTTAEFENHPDANIIISSYGDVGITAYSFTNKGNIIIGPGDESCGLDIPGFTVTNDSCGSIQLFNKLKMVNISTFENYGLFLQDYDGYNEIGADNEVYNYGIIQDNYRAITNVSGIFQEGVVVQPYSEKVYEDLPVQDVIQISDDLEDYEIGNIFTNVDLTSSAGTFNTTTNIWIPNANAVGDSTFFFRVEDIEGGCTDTIRLLLDIPVLETNIWQGGIGSWHTSSNWSKGHIPLQTENVFILEAEDSINIFSPAPAVANKLILHGKLNVGLISTLRILGDSKSNLDLIGGKLYNKGNCELKNGGYGIFADSTAIINNYGSIFLDENYYSSIFIKVDCIFNNLSDGYISSTNSSTGIHINNGTFIDEGECDLADISGSGIVNSGNCTLSGTVNIENCNTGIELLKYTTLDSTSVITIKNCITYGIKVQNSQLSTLLEVTGTVVIDSISSGTAIEIEGSTLFSGSSNLSISNCNKGITIKGGLTVNPSLDFAENSNVIITDIDEIGIEINQGSFTVLDSSIVNIDQVDGMGISIMGFSGGITLPPYYSSLHNYGTIHIKNSIESINGYSYGDLYNYECGRIELDNPLNIFEDYFENNGLLIYNNSDISSINEAILNNGIIVDKYGAMNASVVDNQYILVKPIEDIYTEGDTITNVLVYGSGYSGSGLTDSFYVDSLLTIPGGVFATNQNALVLFSNAVGKDVLYFKNEEICSSIIALQFLNEIEISCGFITWTGGTGNWDDPQQWSKLRLPASCDTIIIQNPSDSVYIENNDTFNIAKLLNTGNILVKANSQLDIQNNVSNGLINEGTISNNGEIIISTNPSFYGIKNHNGYIINASLGKFIFTNGGSLIAQYGNSEFDNHGIVKTDMIGQASKIFISPNAYFRNKSMGVFRVK